MFPNQPTEIGKIYRVAVIGLSLLSTAALFVTLWIMADFLKEQAIVDKLMKELPQRAQDSAEVLAVELRWQFRWAILVVLNVIVTAIAVILLWRAYQASQTSLRDFKALASDVLSGMEQGVITIDTHGLVTSINRRGLELLDSNLSCVGKPIGEFNTIPLQEFHQDWRSRPSCQLIGEFSVACQGHSRRIHVSCQILNDHYGAHVGYVFQIRDVTEQMLIEERIRRMERYMGLGSLAAGLHHEIKNPLAALSLHVQLLEEQLETDGTSADNKQMLSVIRTEVTRIGQVLEGFRDFAAIDGLNLSDVDVNLLLEQQAELIRPQAQQQHIQIIFQPCAAATVIAADRVRLEQAFLNLIVNAMEAMRDGGTLTITTQIEDGALQASIADTGCGVPENLKDKILDPYFTTKPRGTGLGLALCDKIVRQHLGTIDFSSASSGTTFTVTLPLGT